MHIDVDLASDRSNLQRVLAQRLVSLADETDRAGLRQEAAMVLAMAYSVLDGITSMVVRSN